MCCRDGRDSRETWGPVRDALSLVSALCCGGDQQGNPKDEGRWKMGKCWRTRLEKENKGASFPEGSDAALPSPCA